MIDEKKLIEDLQICFLCNYIHKNDLAEVIARQPKVGEWIPVSERLPEENGAYLCQIESNDCSYIETLDFATNLYDVDEWDFCGKKRAGFYDCESEYGCFEVESVIAWMPLPEPYRKDAE